MSMWEARKIENNWYVFSETGEKLAHVFGKNDLERELTARKMAESYENRR